MGGTAVTQTAQPSRAWAHTGEARQPEQQAPREQPIYAGEEYFGTTKQHVCTKAACHINRLPDRLHVVVVARQHSNSSTAVAVVDTQLTLSSTMLGCWSSRSREISRSAVLGMPSSSTSNLILCPRQENTPQHKTSRSQKQNKTGSDVLE